MHAAAAPAAIPTTPISPQYPNVPKIEFTHSDNEDDVADYVSDAGFSAPPTPPDSPEQYWPLQECPPSGYENQLPTTPLPGYNTITHNNAAFSGAMQHLPHFQDQRFTFSNETEEQITAIKLEAPSSPLPIFNMHDHSATITQEPKPSISFDDVNFGEHAMYIRYGEPGQWHQVEYNDTFSEQYDLIKPDLDL